MQIFKHTNYYVAVLLAAAIFTGCTKDARNTPKSAATAAASTTTSSDDGMVVTPAGMMAKSNVHFVEPGTELRIYNNHIQKISSASGKMLQDFGLVSTTTDPIHTANKQMDGLTPSVVNGWAAYAYWSNETVLTNPITYFSTSWTVPAVPKIQATQTIFLFNGLQDGLKASSYIIQPVLQWGGSAAGGGKYWAITSWYVSSSQAFFGTLQTVAAGTKLQGIMAETSATGAKYNYTSSFVGYPAAVNLTVSNVKQAYWAAETLEVYNVANAGEYPGQTSLDFSSIQIMLHSLNASMTWTPVNATGAALPSATVASSSSPGGDVTIAF